MDGPSFSSLIIFLVFATGGVYIFIFGHHLHKSQLIKARADEGVINKALC